MKKGMLLVLVLSALVSYCAGSEDFDVLPGHAPMIHDAYAPSVIRPGATYRIYLHAEDFDGDMKEIVTDVTQTGVEPFPITKNKLEGGDTKEVAGYLYLRTPANARILSDRIEVLLVVRDRRENVSKPIKFSLRFDYGPAEEIPEKWQGVSSRRLGAMTLEDIVPSIERRSVGGGF